MFRTLKPRKLIALGVLLGAVMAVAQAAQNLPKDAAEYNVYYAAVTEADPAKKIAALDAYLAKYPNSVAKEQVLEIKMQTQSTTGAGLPALVETAKALLTVNPKHERARLILSFAFLQAPPAETDPQFQQKLDDAAANAKAGIEGINDMKRGEGVSDADFQANKNVTSGTHYRVLGVIGFLKKDVNEGIANFKKAAEMMPNDASLPAAIADTLARQPQKDYDQIMWYYARADMIEGAQALQGQTKTTVDSYLARAYKNRHGSDEGFDQLKAAAKASPNPPEGFHIKTAAEMAPPPPPPPPEAPIPDDVTKMPFGQIKYVLSKDDDKAKEVFGKLKAVGEMGLDGTIVSFTAPRTVKVAVLKKTQETEGEFDVILVLAAPTTAVRAAKGKSIEFTGVVKDFKANPFALTLTDGKILPPSKK